MKSKQLVRKLEALVKADGDHCSICHSQLPHNSMTFGGETKGGEVALAGMCCLSQMKTLVSVGRYISAEYADLFLRETVGEA